MRARAKVISIAFAVLMLSTYVLSGQQIDTISIKNPVFIHLNDSDGFVSICTVADNLKCLRKGNLKKVLKKDSIYFRSHNFYNYLEGASDFRSNVDWNLDDWEKKEYKGLTYYQYADSLEFYRIKTMLLRFNDLENGFGSRILPTSTRIDCLSVIAPIH